MTRNTSGLKRPYTRRIPESEPQVQTMTEPSNEPVAEAVAPQRRVTRETRRSFGSMDQKLRAEKRPGFHRHWFNEVPGRIDDAREAGYEHVLDRHGKHEKRVVGKHQSGDPLFAYLMEIPEEWYTEDMERLQSRIDETDSAIKRGALGEQQGENRYVPAQGIKIGANRTSR